MELGAAGLKEQPFRTHGKPLVFVGYAGQQKAFEFLQETYEKISGLGLFQGPSLAGKSTVLRSFAETHGDCCAIAIVNGANVGTTALLESILREYGYEYKFDSVNELLNMLKVFMQQQTATGRPPLLIIENTHEMTPDAMGVLCDLASVRVREQFALKIILASDRSIEYIAKAPAMECISRRLTGDFHLQPLTMDETCDYLFAKIRRGGCMEPQYIFSEDVCDEIYRASGGWPGIIDRLALLAIASAEKCPVGPEYVEVVAIPEPTNSIDYLDEPETVKAKAAEPLLYLTHNGKTLRRLRFSGTRLLIGRSEHNDVPIESKFVSRHHALLVRHGKTTLLMDLNSANGTYVNSRRVSNQVLANDDVITLGEHGIKFVDPATGVRQPLEGISFDDTVVLKTVEDMRRVLARENTVVLPAVDEDTKASGDSA